MRKTKIVCTIGPKTESIYMLIKLLNMGMDVMRLNFSHGDHKEHNLRINNLRKAIKKTNKRAAILLDTRGPEIRTMKLVNGKDVKLKKGQFFKFTIDQNFIGNSTKVAVTYKKFLDDLKIGNLVLLDDGLIKMKVINVNKKYVFCSVLNDGVLGENKGVNLPEISIKLPTLSEVDKKDLIFGCKKKIDFVAVSFVRKKSDILEIRKFLDNNKGKDIKIISKIENREGLKNFLEILNVSDGIMVARGDLGVEIPLEEVIFVQKMMIKKCNESLKVIITATQMLDSMIRNPRPTRAEAGDITNAIMDGTDAVMLSGESAKGNYPLESVSTMKKICIKTDKIIKPKIYIKNSKYKNLIFLETICCGAVGISEKIKIKLIIIETSSGVSAMALRKYFPKSMILALTYKRRVANQLILSKGIISRVIKKKISQNNIYNISREESLKSGYAKLGDIVIIISGICKLNKKIHNISIHTL
ncbi:Pyruvate kinase I [Candidatus Annandia adelgestsuga]|uniref:Pyruvate kinase n=1 Tax=Candidatus Annandia adelgestsuga TaxID=1302411 RepID=A0A3S9J7M2_9ENTR|nr:pyruvate kinase PykF [Candidatus Annandia adelgestsuga]AZP36371.1 Pyruvate kinase I [Candidatus Annandia adelgestsuga]